MTEVERVSLFLVEDQPAILRALLKALGLFPEFDILGTAQDGEGAVEEICRLQPRVVLLDLELPGMDGIEVTRRLKSRDCAAEVLILTSFDDEQKVYQAVLAGAAGYLVKRVGPAQIRAAIHEVLGGGVVIEPQIARRFWNYFQSVQAAGAPPTSNPWGLTELEHELLRFLAKGLSNAEVGRVMTLERRTVRTHLGHLYRKMGVRSHVEAVVMALKAGLVEI